MGLARGSSILPASTRNETAMTAEEIADIAWRFLKNRKCPRCEEGVKLEVRLRQSRAKKLGLKEVRIILICKECGVKAVRRFYLEETNQVRMIDTILVRSWTEQTYEELKTTEQNYLKEVAERLMNSV